MSRASKEDRQDFIICSVIEVMIRHCGRLGISDDDGSMAAAQLIDMIEKVDPKFNRKIQLIEDTKNKTLVMIVKEVGE